MDPFTPRPRTVGRKNNLSLSTKEYAKVCNTSSGQLSLLLILILHRQVTGTIASARRNRHRLEGEEQTNGRVSPSAELRWRGESMFLLLRQLHRASPRAFLHFGGIIRSRTSQFTYRFRNHHCKI